MSERHDFTSSDQTFTSLQDGDRWLIAVHGVVIDEVYQESRQKRRGGFMAQRKNLYGAGTTSYWTYGHNTDHVEYKTRTGASVAAVSKWRNQRKAY